MMEVLVAILIMGLSMALAFPSIKVAADCYHTIERKERAQMFLSENMIEISNLIRYADPNGDITVNADKSLTVTSMKQGFAGTIRTDDSTGMVRYTSTVSAAKFKIIAADAITSSQKAVFEVNTSKTSTVKGKTVITFTVYIYDGEDVLAHADMQVSPIFQ